MSSVKIKRHLLLETRSASRSISKMSSTRNINETLDILITTLKPHKLQLDAADSTSLTPAKRPLNTTIDEETPSKRPKLNTSDTGMNASYLWSPQEGRRTRLELMTARERVIALEDHINELHSIRKQMQIAFESENGQLKTKALNDRRTIESLETHVQSAKKREAEARKALSELREEFRVYRDEAEAQAAELEKGLEETKQERRVRVGEGADEVRKLKREVTEAEVAMKDARDEAELNKGLMGGLQAKLIDQNKLREEIEVKDRKLEKALRDLKELEYIKEICEETQQQAKSQQQKLLHYSELEKENKRMKEQMKKLKDEVHNKLVLEEEVHDLKTRLVTFKEHEKKLAVIEVERAQAEVHLSEWRALASSLCETSAPDTSLRHMLRSLVERLQHQEINLASEKMDLEQKFKTVTYDCKVAQSELEKNKKLVTELQTSNQQRQFLIHRLQKKLQLISKERDSYRTQLDSYERDLTICVMPASSAQPGLAQFQTQKDRIDSQERIIDGYRELIAKLEHDLQKAEPNAHIETPPVRRDQIDRLQKEIEKLRTDNDTLRERKDRLEIMLEDMLVGQDTVKDKERVVHAVKNPLSEHLEKISEEKEKLQQEVEKLKRKIRNLEEGLEQSKLNESAINIKEFNGLKEQLKSSELQLQRLKDYFKSSMQEFRNVIYMMLGYKIDKISTANYKLTSMYAEKAEDQICFQLNAEGGLNMLENQFSSSLEDLIDLHLRHQNSIPVFLSALTMELFNNRTVTKTYAIDDDDDEEDD